MTVPPELRAKCEAAIRSLYKDDPASMARELWIFDVTCRLGEPGGGATLYSELKAAGAFTPRAAAAPSPGALGIRWLREWLAGGRGSSI